MIDEDRDSSLISNELSPISYGPFMTTIASSHLKSIDKPIGKYGRGQFEKCSNVGPKSEFCMNLCMIHKLSVNCPIQVDYKVSMITKKVKYTFGIISNLICVTVITIVKTIESLSKSLHNLKMLGLKQNRGPKTHPVDVSSTGGGDDKVNRSILVRLIDEKSNLYSFKIIVTVCIRIGMMHIIWVISDFSFESYETEISYRRLAMAFITWTIKHGPYDSHMVHIKIYRRLPWPILHDNAEAARNYVQDDAVVFLQIQPTNFIHFCSGLEFYILFIIFRSRSVLVSRPT